MSRYSPAQTCESDLVGLLLLASPAPPDDGDHDIGTPSAATLVDGSRAPAAVEEEEEEEEEELAVDPLLHSPLMEDASLVVAMFEPSEAELCSNDVVGATAVSSAAGARLAGASASVVVEEEEERRRRRLPAIKEGEVSECRSTDSEDADIKFSEARRDEEKQSTARRTRSAEVHNRCERRRRGRINQRFKALQELVPRCNDKSDKASILDETIVYMKSLQQQVQMMSGGCDITGMMFPVFQTLMLPGAAIAMNNIGQPPLPGTACSGDVTAGGGGCPSYPALPFGHVSRVPAVSADCTGQQAAAPWPPCPPAFQSMAMASFGQAMGAAIGRQYYTAPNATNMTYQDLPQVGSSPVDGYQFLGIH